MFNFDNPEWDSPDYLNDKFPPRLSFFSLLIYKTGQRTVASILVLLTAIIFIIPLT